MDVTREEFITLKADVDKTKDDVSDLQSELADVRETLAAAMHLIAGGFNIKTQVVDKGLVQNLSDLVDRLDKLGRKIDVFFNRISNIAIWIARGVLTLIATAIVSWVVHSAWPSITHTFTTTNTTTVTHTTTK